MSAPFGAGGEGSFLQWYGQPSAPADYSRFSREFFPVPLPKEGEFFLKHKRSKKEGTHKRPKTGQAPKLRGNEAVVGVEVVVINNTKARARARAKVVVVVAVEGCLPHIVLVAVDVATTRVVGHGVL